MRGKWQSHAFTIFSESGHEGAVHVMDWEDVWSWLSEQAEGVWGLQWGLRPAS